MIFILQILSTLLGAISSLLLFFFGIPAMTKSDTSTGLVINTVETKINDAKNLKKYKLFSIISRLALLMLVSSFLLQFVILFLEK